jgi:hypothetical protein
MAERYDRVEQGDSRQFTITYSVAPTTTPLFTMRADSGYSVLVASKVGTSSSTTDFFAFHTFSHGIVGLYCWTWTASYASVGPVVERGVVNVIATNTW